MIRIVQTAAAMSSERLRSLAASRDPHPGTCRFPVLSIACKRLLAFTDGVK